MSFIPGYPSGPVPGAGGGGQPGGGGGAWGAIGGRIGGAGGLGDYGYSMPSFQGETSVFKADKPPTQGISPTMPFQFVTKLYADKNITYTHSAVPTDAPAEGTLRSYSSSGTYRAYVYLADGWRKVDLT